MTRTCESCGKEFEYEGHFRIYCSPECQKMGMRTAAKERKKKETAPRPPQPDTKRCRHCIYSSHTGNGTTICNYILIMGVPRGCPGGKDCDKYVATGKRKEA